MKIRPSSLFLAIALAVLGTSALPAAPAHSPAKAFRLSTVEQHNQAAIELGTPQFTVRRVLGEPRRKLDADTWLYDRFSSSDWKIDTGDCSILLIAFTQGKVSDLKLVNDRAEKVIAASLAKKEAVIAVAKKYGAAMHLRGRESAIWNLGISSRLRWTSCVWSGTRRFEIPRF